MTTAQQRIVLDEEPVELLTPPDDEQEPDDEPEAITAAGLDRQHQLLLAEASAADLDALAAEFDFNPNQRRGSDGKWIKGGSVATPKATRAAFDGKARPGAATRLASAEFERQVPPEKRFYRGVHAPVAAEHTREGGIGGGDFGPGVYMDPRIATAQGYAGRNGVVLRMGLQPGTKVKRIPQRVARGGSAAIDEWATEGKFDAISTGDGLYVIVRNPDALITDERNYTTRETVILDYLAKGYDMPDGYEEEIAALQRDGIIPAAVTAAEFRFDPNQPRDREGKWTDGAGGLGVADPDTLEAWGTQAADPGHVTGDDLMRIGARIGEIMTRDGTSMMDPLAMMRATREATAEDDADISARQYVRAMDRDYGTNIDKNITDALAAQGSATEEDRAAVELERTKPEPIVYEPEPAPTGPPQWSPDFDSTLADRQAALQRGIDSGPKDGEELAGGDVASTFGFTWNDGSRAVLKEAKRQVRGMSPVEQTDAEELAGLVANLVGIRAPATHRVSDTEIYQEYMPGETGMKKFGGSPPYRLTNSEEGLRLGVFDQLIGNNDRHTGNWTVDADDRLYAIDHGLAFGTDDGVEVYGPFAFELLYGGHEIKWSEFEDIRTKLSKARPEFQRLGRAEWYDKMIGRLDAMQNRIGGLG